MKIIVLTIFYFLFSVLFSKAQKLNKDSLFKIIKSNKHDTIRVKAFSSLCYMFRYSDQDTALYFGTQGLNLANKIKWEKGIANCFKNLGVLKFETGEYEIAIDFFMKSLKIDEKNKDQRGMAASYNHIGSVYQEQNRFDKAEEYYLKSLHIRETLKDLKGIAASYNNIGLVYYSMNDFMKSLDYYLKSLKMKEGSGDKYNIAGGYNNVGMVHSAMGHSALALEYYRKSLKLREEINDKKGIAAVLGNISILCNTMADSSKNSIEKKQLYSESVKYGLQCLQISEEINALLWKNKTAEELQKAYKGLGNYQKALDYAELFIRTNDSLFKDDKIKAITEIDVKYQTEKKEQLIELQKNQIDKKVAEAKQHRTFIYAISAVLFLVLMLFIIAVFAYRQKKKANILLTQQKHEINEKNEELNQQKEEIITQRDEIENQRNQILERNAELNQKNEEIAAQRDFVIKQGEILSIQNQTLEDQKQAITDSILYARRIQQVLLPKEDTFASVFKENFILFKPRDIVSGDFYWIKKFNNCVIFCIADCTGHGVPGAFMSMLGISFLNEIIRNKEVVQASCILDELRKHIIDSLHQEGNTYEQKDGMDIALCILNLNNMELQFAGANNPIYIIKQFGNLEMNQSRNKFGTGLGNESEDISHLSNYQIIKFPNLIEPVSELVEIKGDKMPIGFHENIIPFSNSTIQLNQGDTLYLFSDGFADQFGGENETKYKITPFRELIISVSSQPLQKQYEILDTTIENWINYNGKSDNKSFEQTDDITVIGLRI